MKFKKKVAEKQSSFPNLYWDKNTKKWQGIIHHEGKSIFVCSLKSQRKADKKVRETKKELGIVKKGASRYKGVSWRSDRQIWKAQICVNKKAIYLGSFETEEEAHEAYQKALRELK